MSVAIFNFIQLGRDEDAIRLLLISVVLSFVALSLSEYLLRRNRS
jgi:ABC-type molybdate transport system permease subunit